LHYFGDPGAAGSFPAVPVSFSGEDVPAFWLLGSSPQSAIWAAERGLPYVFADFINPEGAAMARFYRERFRPSAHLQKPYVVVASWAICADTDAEALRLSASWRMMMTFLFRGRLIPVPTVQRAEQFFAEEGVPVEMLPIGRRAITGSPAKVAAELRAVAQEYTADEVMIVNIMHDHAARRRSYQLIAQEFQLAGPVQEEVLAQTAG
jgi:luciferase family oxidoreductase group 1